MNNNKYVNDIQEQRLCQNNQLKNVNNSMEEKLDIANIEIIKMNY